MAQLNVTKTYVDGETPTQVDFDNICDSIETFLNVTKLASDNITDNSIDASAVFDAGSITEGKIANDAVTTAKIADGAVTSDKIATSAITTAKILDANVTSAKIASGAVTNVKVADGAVTIDKKPTAVGSTGGSAANSFGSLVFTGTSQTSSTLYPTIVNGGAAAATDSSLSLASTTTGVTMEGSLVTRKDSTTVMNQEFKAGPFAYSAGTDTNIAIPASSALFLQISTTSSDTAITHNMGVDLTTGSSMGLSGISSVGVI